MSLAIFKYPFIRARLSGANDRVQTVLDVQDSTLLISISGQTLIDVNTSQGEGKMNEDVAIIEGVYDIVLPEVPASLHRWGRKVWLRDIEVGAKGRLLFYEEGVYKITSLSRITNIMRNLDFLEIHTQRSIYKLRLLVE